MNKSNQSKRNKQDRKNLNHKGKRKKILIWKDLKIINEKKCCLQYLLIFYEKCLFLIKRWMQPSYKKPEFDRY